MRRVLIWFFRSLAKVFFRRIEIAGLDNIPREGPVIFAVNHPNGLVDPLFLLCFAPRPVSFLAKAPLFRYPIIGFFTRRLDSIPVYRRQDGMLPEQNRETFEKSRALLARGASIAIFPEGTSHSDPKLRELKTGAARIALGASSAAAGRAAGAPIAIVPAGIYYTAKKTFRSSALVVFGAPIPVQPVQVGPNGEPPADAVERLTEQIENALSEITLQAGSRSALKLIARGERVFSAASDIKTGLADELALRRRFVEGYSYLSAHDPAKLAELESHLTRFEAELGAASLQAENLVSHHQAHHQLGPAITTLLALVLLLPLALAGAVIHYPAYRLVGFLAVRIAKGADDLIATIKFLAALLLFPLTWIAFALGAWRVTGGRAALVALIVVPLLGYIALRAFEGLDEVIGRTRALVALALGRRSYQRLLDERRHLRDEILAVAEEMERG
ncbi:MAG TPA: lysophospholipid acyltransferase family protein [Thermoanaerobaculia bacterium]|nr:lysophospholipid acyltransferase family protein [Thermoanaerobaculia bacterium]